MLELFLPSRELWNSKTEEYEYCGGVTVELEHSLYTIAGWEAKWKKAFATKEGLNRKELLNYISEFMCQTKGIKKSDWLGLDKETLQKIQNYIKDPMTATTVKHRPGQGNGRKEVVTAELIYFHMTQFGIPFTCEHWHLNRLMTLIDVCSVKSVPPKKMGKKEAAAARAAQNAQMRGRLGSRG